MPIRDHYIGTFERIGRRYGEEDSNCEIGPNDSLRKVIGYTRSFVVEHGEEHFRYDYYRRELSEALRRLGFHPQNRQVVHLDVGCGPGLFSWVVRDYMLSEHGIDSGRIDLIGYDHARNMIVLADLFRQRLPVEYNFNGYSEIEEVCAALSSRDFSASDVVVTFGHVLIQMGDNAVAMGDFAETIRRLFPSHSCIALAVDAYRWEERRQAFRNACERLRIALSGVGVTLEHGTPDYRGSRMSGRLSMEG